MTTSMIITLIIVIGMIAIIISDKLPFGAPALLAAVMLVATNQADAATAFSGFTDKNVIMIMGFMVAMVGLNKTELIYKIRIGMGRFAVKGGLIGLLGLVIAVMAVGNFVTGTALYVLVLNIVAAIPSNDKLPTSRIILPAAIATTASKWLPTGLALYTGLVGSLCESAGYTGPAIDVTKMCIINIVFSVCYILWVIVGHKLLPATNTADTSDLEQNQKEFVPVLTNFQQNIVYIGYAVILLTMIFLSKFPGNIGHAVPLVVSFIYLMVGAINFKEFLKEMFSPLMIMMASVIGVAATMSSCGLSEFIGTKIAVLLGTNPSLFMIVLVFACVTSLLATFTGASFGSLFITGPIGIALCIQYGYSPIPLAYACVLGAWTTFVMPIDGLPAMALGMGKYKLSQFWAYVVPVWIIKMLVTCYLGVLFFA